MPSTEQDGKRPESLDSLRSIWAAGGQPQPVPPWYRRLTRVQVGVAAGCLAALLAGYLAIRSVDSGTVRHEVALPSEFAGLPRVAEAQDLATLRASYERQDARHYVPWKVQVQGYGQPGATGLWESELVAVAMESRGSVPDASRAATELLGGYSPDGGSLRDGTPVDGMRTYPPGPLNGALACATLGGPGEEYAACAWADGNTMGVLFDRTGELTAEQLAARTSELRTVTEQPA
ncbi:hypothetical protein [Kitasatospora phosalacinea]|uniref:Uncharacterized protein n=1 Tax=Kitasatospora phosalacinea TaxID=2065 RepID=A0A9W6UMM3_9ACTN|nr:hypothetical protein [Kitasatospora phosalacinea]GLW55601.1 hypothetical protein Kpho01_36120 [Kitasatospora phosalacinea]